MDEKNNPDSGLDEEGPEGMGPLTAPKPDAPTDEERARRDDGPDDVRDQMSVTPE
jgi:hypothetical protein